MRAFNYSAYSHKPLDVMTMAKDTPKPDGSKLKADEILVQVHASSINYSDRVVITGAPWMTRFVFGVLRPKVHPGCDFAGHVVALGRDVADHKVGDPVFGNVAGYGFGAWADFVVAHKTCTSTKPKNLTFLEAACIPAAGTVALQGVREHGKLTAGESVMINAAGGGIGHFALQIAKALDAGSVAAYTSSPKMRQATVLGADKVFDYKLTDFTKEGTKYDLVVDCFATDKSLKALQGTIEDEKGRYIQAGGSIWRSFVLGLAAPFYRNKGQTMKGYLTNSNKPDLDFLGKLAEEGKLKPQISSVVNGLDELPKAFDAYMKGGVPAGKIAIAVDEKAHQL